MQKSMIILINKLLSARGLHLPLPAYCIGSILTKWMTHSSLQHVIIAYSSLLAVIISLSTALVYELL